MLINSLGLKNFKCFEALDVKFAPITLLTGANSSGKSSLINAILAMLQTEQFPFYLSPNGKYVNMGSFEEMAHWAPKGKKQKIEIDIMLCGHSTYDKYSIFKTIWKEDKKNNLPKLAELTLISSDNSWQVKERKNNSYSTSFSMKNFYNSNHGNDFIELKEVFPNIKITPSKEYESTNNFTIPYTNFENFNKFVEKLDDDFSLPSFRNLNLISDFNYLGSFRLPPERTYYQKPKAADRVSISGEGYIDQIIEWEETDPDTIGILTSILAKMELLTQLKSTKLKGGRFDLSIKVHEDSNLVSLSDVGFGISQFLPIIVADLQLDDDSCLAVSQPEIHLHPKIQAAFGNYLANQVNSTQKQYIIETHSEYLLNRIRLLLVTGELKPEQVRVLYFENDGIKSTVHDIEFATNGSVKGAPQGFFDTYEIDIMDIAMSAIG